MATNVQPIALRDERNVPTPTYDVIERHRIVYPTLPARDGMVWTRNREEGAAPIPEGSAYYPQLSNETTRDIYISPNLASGTPRDADYKKRLKALKILKRRETQYSIRNVYAPGGLDYASDVRVRPALGPLDTARKMYQEEEIVEYKDPKEAQTISLGLIAVLVIAIMILRK